MIQMMEISDLYFANSFGIFIFVFDKRYDHFYLLSIDNEMTMY